MTRSQSSWSQLGRSLLVAGVVGATLVASTSTASSRPAASLADPQCEVGARVDPLAPTLDRAKRPRVPAGDPPLLPPLPLLSKPTASASTRAATTAPSLVEGFGQGGKVTTNLSRSRSGGTDVALQTDGKILVAGYTLISANSNFVVARYLRDGRLDPGFGAGGTVMTDFGGEDEAAAIAIQPDAKIIVVGSTTTATTRVALARYQRDGGLDQSFGTGGKVVMHLAGRGPEALSAALDVAIESNGRIVVAGTSRRTIGRSTGTLDFAVARYTPRGVLDTTFGSDGVTTIDFGRGNDVARALTLGNGGIVVAGYTVPPGDVLITAAVARLRPGGALDSTFGAGGRATLQKEFLWRSWEAVAVQHDGKIVVAGWGSNCLTFVFSVARYTRTGALDTGFGAGGSVETSPSGVLFDFATDVILLPDGRILAGGVTVDPANWDYDYALVRYRANGRLDSLRRGAPAVTILRPSAGDDEADGLAVQPDGRAVLATSSGGELGAARVTAAGGLDGSFGTGGVANSHASAAADFGRDVIVQPDGMIVVAGVVMFGQTPAGALVRYGPDGTRDTAFRSPLSIVRPSSLAFVEGRRVATVGECCNSGGQGESGYAQGLGTRYLPDGLEDGFVLGLTSNATAQRRSGLLSVAALPGGTAVAAGFVETAGNSDFALSRWDLEWRRDASFGTNGTVTTAIGSGNERAAAIARQPDGKVVVTGFTDRNGTEDFALVRYLENGSLDLTFGSGGVVVTPFGSGHDRATSLALQPDGRIVVAGWTHGAAGADVAVARYRADGTLDPSFGTGGKAVFALAAGEDTAADVLVRADGVILVAATVATGAAADFALARVSPNGGAVETTRTDFSGGEDVARALALLPDGTVVVAGTAYSARRDHDFALARYSAP